MSQTLPDYVASAEKILADFQVSYAQVSEALRANSASPQQLESLRTEAEGIRARIRQLRLSFDEVDILAYEGVERADRRAYLWSFEKALRARLVDLSGNVSELIQALDGLIDGAQYDRVAFGRDGETLQGVAAREMGNWESWRSLQDANRTVPPGGDPAGKPLVVPGSTS